MDNSERRDIFAAGHGTQVQIQGTTGALVGSRIIERGKNNGMMEVIVYGLHLGNRRNHSKTFFLAPDAVCEVVQ